MTANLAATTRVERICFEANYGFLIVVESPSLYIDEDFYTPYNHEAEIFAFGKSTRTVENVFSLLATLPRLRQLDLRLDIELKPWVDLHSDDQEDDEADSVDFGKIGVANERATELSREDGTGLDGST